MNLVRWFKSAPESLEIALVLCVTFGWFVGASTVSMLSTGDEVLAIRDKDAWTLLALELVFGGLALVILLLRNKRPKDFGLNVSLHLTVQGVVLCVLTVVLFYIAFTLMVALAGDTAGDSPRIDLKMSLFPALLLLLVNPIFEEFFVAGYFIRSLQDRWGKGTSLLGSVALRVSYHTDQGRSAMLFTLCLGLLFGLAYLRNRQLWPLFTGHAVLEGIGLIERQ